MRATLARLICGLVRGHLPVTKSGGGRVQTECYLCGSRIGSGWDVRDLTPPAGMPDVRTRHATASRLVLRRRA